MQPDITAIGSDPDALEAFYREHLEAVQRYVARRVADPHAAADLTADIFLEAMAAGVRYRPELGSPRAWLYGVARHVVAMHLRRGVREAQALGRAHGRRALEQDAIQRIVERIDAEREARALLALLDDLDEGQRAVVELVAVDGLTPTEAGAVLGISPVAVRVRLHRARRRLAALRSLPTPSDSTEEVPS